MTYQIIILKESKLNNFFFKIRKNLKTFELCQPSLFLPIEKTYNLHKFNTNFIFKVKNSSPLTYFICRINNKEKVTLNSVINEFDGSIETISYRDEVSTKKTVIQYIVLALLFAINMDLLLAIAFYIINFKKFQLVERVSELNIFAILAACAGLLNFSILGLKLQFINLPSILNFPPNIGYFFKDYISLGIAFLIVCIISYIFINLFFGLTKETDNTSFKSLNDLKI
jgi:hypothetical protein